MQRTLSPQSVDPSTESSIRDERTSSRWIERSSELDPAHSPTRALSGAGPDPRAAEQADDDFESRPAPRRRLRLLDRFRRAWIGVDLGSQTMRAQATGKHARLESLPSAVAIETRTDRVVAIGEAARQMIDRTPAALRVETPITQGVIARPAEAELLIRQLLLRAHPCLSIVRPHAVIGVPSEATSVQRHALRAAAQAAGAGRVTLIRECLAAAVGADLPILEPDAQLIVEMGAEKSEVTVVALGGIVVSAGVAVGGRDVSEAIALYVRRQHHLLIGRASADTLKHELASAIETSDPKTQRVRGRDYRIGRPASIEIKANELVPTVKEALQPLRAALREVLERTPPELASDLATSGLILSGGASQLKGIEAFLATTSGLSVSRIDDPSQAVVRGCRRIAASPALRRALAAGPDLDG